MGIKKVIVSVWLFCSFAAARGQDQAAFIETGNALYKNGKLADAVANYNKVTKEKYKYTALLNKGTALYKLKKPEDAKQAYTKVCEAVTATAALRSDAYYNLGVVYSHQKKLKESIDAYKNALRLNHNDDRARENLQKALSGMQKGGGGSSSQPLPPRENKSKAQQELNKLEEKEKNTMSRIPGKKASNGGNMEKDW